MEPRVCVVTGVGPGTGAALARRFAADYRVALVARNAERLEKLAAELPGASAYPVDVAHLDALGGAPARAPSELGAPAVPLDHAVDGGFGTFHRVAPWAVG